MREHGTCRMWNGVSGYGFIVPSSKHGSDDLFVHISALPRDTDLHVGDKVSFERVAGRKGMQAANVTIENDNPPAGEAPLADRSEKLSR